MKTQKQSISVKDFYECLIEEININPEFSELTEQEFSVTSPIVKEFKEQYEKGKSIESILFFYKYRDVE